VDTGGNLTRRSFLKSLGVGAVVTLVPFACGRREQAAEGEGAQPGAAMSEGGHRDVYTRENPGPWGAKIEGHIPRATLTKLDEEGNFRVDIVVNHEMNPEKPHWIQFIALDDQDDRQLAKRGFVPADPKAEASFMANVRNLTKFRAYEQCNVHGLWLEEYQIPA